MIQKCWSESPKDRPTFSEIEETLKSSTFLKNFDEEADIFQDYCMFVDKFDKMIEDLDEEELDKLIKTQKNRFQPKNFNYFYPLEKLM